MEIQMAQPPLSQRFRTQDPVALDLLERMLVFDPRKRVSATESLGHEYVSPYHDPTDEPEAAEQFDWSFNDADLPVDTWKVMMYSEILDFHQLGDTADGLDLSAMTDGMANATVT